MLMVWLNTLLKGSQMIGNKKKKSNRTFETVFHKQFLILYTSICNEQSWDTKK